MLENAGLDFAKHENCGIPHMLFAEHFISSGLLLNNQIKWVAFNSAFDFGYMLKMVTSLPLPHSEGEFLKLLELHFPVFYDVKHLRMDDGDLNSQLRNESIVREGVAHQAGSDSLVTSQLYHKSIRDPRFRHQNMKEFGRNIIYKLGEAYKKQERRETHPRTSKQELRRSDQPRSRRHQGGEDYSFQNTFCQNLQDFIRAGEQAHGQN